MTYAHKCSHKQFDIHICMYVHAHMGIYTPCTPSADTETLYTHGTHARAWRLTQSSPHLIGDFITVPSWLILAYLPSHSLLVAMFCTWQIPLWSKLCTIAIYCAMWNAIHHYLHMLQYLLLAKVKDFSTMSKLLSSATKASILSARSGSYICQDKEWVRVPSEIPDSTHTPQGLTGYGMRGEGSEWRGTGREGRGGEGRKTRVMYGWKSEKWHISVSDVLSFYMTLWMPLYTYVHWSKWRSNTPGATGAI